MADPLPPSERILVSRFRINKGRVYRYLGGIPFGCAGNLYKVIDFIIDVPSYQEKVLVLALNGRDKGLRFTCTLVNFSQRYEPAVEETEECDPPIEPPTYREVNLIPTGMGT